MRIAESAVSRVIKGLPFRDHSMMTFDNMNGHFAHDAAGNNMGRRLSFCEPRMTVDGRTVTYDSTGAFLVGELERLDMTVHEPLASVSWGRDIDLREDVTIADDVSSFTLSTYGSAGGLGTGNGIGNGKAWIGKSTDQITGVSADIAKIPHPLHPWGVELKYTILELESSAKMGRPIDQQKYDGMQLKHQMDIDEQVYIGDTSISATGLVNNALVTNVSNVVAGLNGTTPWTTKTPQEILADVNAAINSVWAASAWAVMPTKVLLPPVQFGYLSAQLISQAGNISILKFLLDNNVVKASGRGQIEFLPTKWNIGAAAGGTIGVADGHDRMVVYTKRKDYVRFPMTLLQRTPLQYDSIYQKTTYFCKLGEVEVVYPETLGYFDGI